MADQHEQRELSKRLLKDRSNIRRTGQRNLSPSKYVLKKRRPFGLRRNGAKDIFITHRTGFKAQLKKCEKLLDSGVPEIIMHGLGAAIQRACILALKLKEIHCGSIDLDVKTSTVSIIDDFEPLNDSDDYEINNRSNSAIHIRVFRKFSISGLKFQE